MNVARAVKTLGLPPLATGFSGGPTGERILEELAREGISARFVRTAGESRCTITVLDETTGVVTEVREPGEAVCEEEIGEFLNLFEEICRSAVGRSVVVFSGSLRPGLAPDFYARLIGVAKRHGLLTILDTSGDALKRGAGAGPFLVKINLAEARELAATDRGTADPGRELSPPEAAALVAPRIATRGPETVVVSLGEHGAVMYCKEQTWFGHVRIDGVRNPVGSGDSMAGGMASALVRGGDMLDAFKLGIACGAANALTPTAAEFRMEDVTELLERVEVRSYGSCKP